MSPMKKTLLGAMAGLSLPMMLSVTPITIAHADPVDNDTLTITVNNVKTSCPLVDDSTSGAVGATRCNFPAGFDPPNKGAVSLKEPDGTKSDILWTHNDDHFHFISDPSLTFPPGHRGEFNTDLGSVEEKAGPIDVSAQFGFAANSGITVVVTSDAPKEVPEPSTLSLLVLSLAGLGYRLRQRKL